MSHFEHPRGSFVSPFSSSRAVGFSDHLHQGDTGWVGEMLISPTHPGPHLKLSKPEPVGWSPGIFLNYFHALYIVANIY